MYHRDCLPPASTANDTCQVTVTMLRPPNSPASPIEQNTMTTPSSHKYTASSPHTEPHLTSLASPFPSQFLLLLQENNPTSSSLTHVFQSRPAEAQRETNAKSAGTPRCGRTCARVGYAGSSARTSKGETSFDPDSSSEDGESDDGIEIGANTNTSSRNAIVFSAQKTSTSHASEQPQNGRHGHPTLQSRHTAHIPLAASLSDALHGPLR